MKEFQLIEKIFKPLTKGDKAALGLANDVAKISLKQDEELLISKDVFVENVHFSRADGGFKIAAKLLRTNLSDLASSGATPLHYMLGFCKNKNLDAKFFHEFARGLKSVQNEFGLTLIGGDTVSSNQLFFSVTIFGKVKKGKILTRNLAKNGDLIFVSGSVGDAHIGLHFAKQTKAKSFFLDRHFFPTPRIELGKKLLEKKLSQCAIDVSDGLLADLRHLCEESKLDAEIFLDRMPFSSQAKNFLQNKPQETLLDLLSGGDDYELIFTSAKKNQKQIAELSKALKLDLTCIGQMKKSSSSKHKITLRDEKNREVKIKKFGYEHV